MYIIVGLGNPTAQYVGTRHNIGFAVIDKLAEQYNITIDTKKHKALIGKGLISHEKVILVKPQTYMNLSGECLRELVDYYKVENDNIIVIYDDIMLDVGQLRVRGKGSAGGHNGIKNIILHLHSEVFARVRVGVGEKPRHMDLADYVLGKFKEVEKEDIQDGIKNATEAVVTIIEQDVEVAMNRFNAKKK